MANLLRFRIYDTLTEKFSDEHVIFVGKHSSYIDKNYAKFFFCFLESVVRDADIIGKAFRLFLYLTTKMQYNSLVVTIDSIPNVCAELKITERTYYRWINILQKKGLIKKNSKNSFVINANFAVVGSRRKAVKNLEKAKVLKLKR